MTYRIEFTPDTLHVRADLTSADVGEMVAVINALSPFLAGSAVERPVPVEWHAIKATRADKALGKAAPPRAEKEAKRDAAARIPRPVAQTEPEGIAPEPQEADAADAEAPAERIDTDDGDRLVPRYDAKLARDERIRELWPTDMTLAMIGEEVGISVPSVSLAAKRMGLPSRMHRANHRPADPPEDAPAPSPPPAPKVAPETNGHVFTMHGVSLEEEAVVFDGKIMDITLRQHRLLHALLRAAPHPVGRPFLIGKVYPGRKAAETEAAFGLVVKDLSKNLPAIGLGINDMKGVGIALTGSDA